MADFAAHLNQRQSLNRPSFFELVAQEGMETTLRRAFEFFLKQISMSCSTNHGWLFRHCDEIYAAFNFLLQYHSVSRYEASISEKFYGMKRVPSVQSQHVSFYRRISDTQKMLSMFFLVAVPYIKVQLDKLYSRLQEEHEIETEMSEHGFQHVLKESFFKTYPYIHFIWESLILLYQLLYLFKYSKFYSPSLMLAGVQLARQTEEDLLFEDVRVSSNSSITKLLGFVVSLLAKSVPVGVFFLKFLSWWHSDEHAAVTASIARLPVPPPPDPLQPAPGVSLPPHPAQCPLCYKSRRTASVLTTSGYVFCYACAYDYIEQNGKCPVTHLPTTTLQLVRLYPNS